MSRGPRLAALVLCFAAACLAYGSSLSNRFAYDDQSILVDNPVVTGHAGPGRIFTGAYWGSRRMGGLYRPLTIASYAFNHRLWGLQPFGYHLVNVMLHGVVTLLVLLVALEWLPLAGAFVAALLFAVHPLHSEAVANVVGRAELLAALGVLLAWRLEPAGAAGLSRQSLWLRRVGAALAFGLGLFSKEVAIAWLGISLLLAFLRPRRPDAIMWVFYGIITLGYFLLRLEVLGSFGNPPELKIYRIDNVIATQSWLAGLWTALGVFGRYVSLLLFPWRLTADYSWPMIEGAGPAEPWAWLGLGATVGLGALAVVALRRTRRSPPIDSVWPALAVGLAVFGFAFFPVSNFVLRIGTIMAERVLYLPSVGFALVAGAVGQWAWRRSRGPGRGVLIALLAVLTLAGAARCWTRSRDWHDSLSLYQSTVRTSPGSARAHASLGMELLKRDRSEEARAELDRAVTLDDTYVEAWVDLGSIHLLAGRMDEARSALRRALKAEPTWYSALVGLGGVELRARRPREALPPLEDAIRLYPGSPEGWYNIGLARAALGDTVSAVQALRESARLAPQDPEAQNNLAWFLATATPFRSAREEAVTAARAALAVRPDGDTWDTLAEALARAGHRAEAIDACGHALAAGVGAAALTRARLVLLQSGRPYPG